MKRIINHWTAGSGRANDTDKAHYHLLVEYDGTIIKGTHEVADNVVTSDGDYAAHTRNLNTDSIGVAACGMRGATEYPFDAGPAPITEKAFKTLCVVNAELCMKYGIAVTPETVLTHAEVEPNLGVKQSGKWDYTRLPHRPDLVGAKAIGDYLRSEVTEILRLKGVVPKDDLPVLRVGSRGPMVADAQAQIAALRYFTGKIDGIYGTRTREAVLAFQADNGLATDGAIGPNTRAALETAEARQEREVSMIDLRSDGSRILGNADKLEVGVGGVAAVSVASQAIEAAQGATGLLDALKGIPWPTVALIIAGALAVFYFTNNIKKARLDDARTGANIKG
ncbi:N-acetylmuramoyl-L-alanine amidase [Halocynthiibacter sp. C4]|uniref:peptidoglycan recognition protein family protein n=1 Tax=Halocynthiibacter sp. C4 TaxID=2992758 RepID=UPI00237A46C9|nr:N-acetylmuramoyl-L-alanine amidase [Halocynthiibacter sp. C4]MDE0590408.1 N-acetylmuramoyl-L-alanine amidase [Halocynthiibacter sp. C4]